MKRVELVLVLMTSIGVLAGCSKRKEECAALEAPRAEIRTKGKIDVSDDSKSDKKSAQLKEFLQVASRAEQALNAPTSDSELRAAVELYRMAMANMVTGAKELDAVFVAILETDKDLAKLAVADAAVKKAQTAFISSLSVDEKQALIDALAGQKDESAVLMRLPLKSQDAKEGKEKYAAALNAKAKVIAETEGLSKRLEELEKQSEKKRGAFRDAGEALAEADKGVSALCEQKK